MPEWIYFIHPPREDFAATMTTEEQAAWAIHFARFQRMLDGGLADRGGSNPGSHQYRDRHL